MRSIDLNITERLHERVLAAAAHEGMTFDGYVEHALSSAAVETERHAARVPSTRDPAEYPHKCDYCEDRFRLPMHRARHVKWTHPEMWPDKDEEPVVEVTGSTEELVVQVETDPRFKLDPEIDQDLLDTFDQRYYDDVPRLD